MTDNNFKTIVTIEHNIIVKPIYFSRPRTVKSKRLEILCSIPEKTHEKSPFLNSYFLI